VARLAPWWAATAAAAWATAWSTAALTFRTTMIVHVRADDRLERIGPRWNLGMAVRASAFFQLGGQAAVDLIIEVVDGWS
jgi:hypothetical protein